MLCVIYIESWHFNEKNLIWPYLCQLFTLFCKSILLIHPLIALFNCPVLIAFLASALSVIPHPRPFPSNSSSSVLALFPVHSLSSHLCSFCSLNSARISLFVLSEFSGIANFPPSSFFPTQLLPVNSQYV